ncbi:MAG TPA: hypothetical protein VFR58_16525 [Flavisolibacter sp.]|nr:hypothetical protein [Flavisolibacter sp.]
MIVLPLIILSAILLGEFIFAEFYPSWNFISPVLININRVITIFAFFLLLFFFLLVFRAGLVANIIFGSILLFFFAVCACFTLNPIDTHTLPVDESTLFVYPDGKKVVVRSYQNAKTNGLIRDTVLVKEVYVFRQVIRRLR